MKMGVGLDYSVPLLPHFRLTLPHFGRVLPHFVPLWQARQVRSTVSEEAPNAMSQNLFFIRSTRKRVSLSRLEKGELIVGWTLVRRRVGWTSVRCGGTRILTNWH